MQFTRNLKKLLQLKKNLCRFKTYTLAEIKDNHYRGNEIEVK